MTQWHNEDVRLLDVARLGDRYRRYRFTDPEAESALQQLRAFLYERLYEAPRLGRQTSFVRSLIESLWEIATTQEDRFFASVERMLGPLGPPTFDVGRRFIDAIASMTDRQVLSLGRTLRLPKKARSMPSVAAAR